jgi:hypothetical protein
VIVPGFADDLAVLAGAALGPDELNALAEHGLAPGAFAEMVNDALIERNTTMITNVENKARCVAEVKEAPVAVPIDAAATYRPEQGWRAVHDRWGRRCGFFHDSQGYRDDPAYDGLLRPSPDPAKAMVRADPFVIAADHALRDARRATEEAKVQHGELLDEARRIREEIPNAYIEYPTRADAGNRTNGRLVGYTDADLRRARAAAAEFWRDVVEPAEAIELRASAAYHTAVTDAYARHSA